MSRLLAAYFELVPMVYQLRDVEAIGDIMKAHMIQIFRLPIVNRITIVITHSSHEFLHGGSSVIVWFPFMCWHNLYPPNLNT